MLLPFPYNSEGIRTSKMVNGINAFAIEQFIDRCKRLTAVKRGKLLISDETFDVPLITNDGVTVANSLVWQHRDSFSRFLAIPPSGLLGDITLTYMK